MSKQLYALYYWSHSTRAISDAEAAELALRSAQNNARFGVTGLLLYGGTFQATPGVFAQWIEGEKTAIQSLFKRIAADPRHTDVQLIAEGHAEDLVGRDGRLFPDWGMRFETVASVPVTLPAFLADWLAHQNEPASIAALRRHPGHAGRGPR